MILLLSLAALALLTTLWWQRTQSVRDTALPSELRVPDYTMRDFELTAMNPDGDPDYRLSAAFMRHFPDDDSAEFEQPRLLYHHTADDIIRFTAEHGWMASRGTEVKLLGEVKIDAGAGVWGGYTTLLTHDLTVIPAAREFHTSAAIRIDAPGIQVEAIGMHGNLNTGKLNLNAKVRGRYAP